jgi:putative spermidine/putrescine transport system substrate-binding protein
LYSYGKQPQINLEQRRKKQMTDDNGNAKLMSQPHTPIAGAMTRRTVLRGTAVGVGLSFVSIPARAEASELVVANWGGDAAKAVLAAWGGFKDSTGLGVSVDGSGTPSGKIRAMVEAKHAIWDVVDSSFGDSIQLGGAGYLEEIDYGIVDKSKVLPGMATKYGISNYLFSYIMAVNTTVFKGNPPRNWQQFWDVKAFPGKRMLSSLAQGVLEAALLADGVKPDALYPIDVDRALSKVSELKENCIFWKTGAELQDLLRQGEVAAGFCWSNRAAVVAKEMKDVITWNWDEAILASSAWIVPKGNPAGKEVAMKFINYTLSPEGQAKVFSIVGMSPSNPQAASFIPKADNRYNATAPENTKNQILLQDAWYGEHGDDAQAKYLQTISG